MNKEIILYGDIKIEICKFHYSRYAIKVNNLGVDKVIISKRVSFCKKGFKYFIGCKDFIGYKDDKKVKPLCIMFPKMSGYVKRFDETKLFFDKNWWIVTKI